MMQRGNCKVPLERIPALAEACGVSPIPILRIAMKEYQPELWVVLQAVFGRLLTEEESRWLQILRAQMKRGKVDVDAELSVAMILYLDKFLSDRKKAKK
jgi:hypothetical protein